MNIEKVKAEDNGQPDLYELARHLVSKGLPTINLRDGVRPQDGIDALQRLSDELAEENYYLCAKLYDYPQLEKPDFRKELGDHTLALVALRVQAEYDAASIILENQLEFRRAYLRLMQQRIKDTLTKTGDENDQ